MGNDLKTVDDFSHLYGNDISNLESIPDASLATIRDLAQGSINYNHQVYGAPAVSVDVMTHVVQLLAGTYAALRAGPGGAAQAFRGDSGDRTSVGFQWFNDRYDQTQSELSFVLGASGDLLKNRENQPGYLAPLDEYVNRFNGNRFDDHLSGGPIVEQI